MRLTKINGLLLILAGLAVGFVYYPVLDAGWFYDDADYVTTDPRLNHLELFLPSHWSDPPPKLENPQQEPLYLPGYGKPLIADRYLQRLSFALERALTGAAYSPVVAHAVNIFLHLACVTALFFALGKLTRLYVSTFMDRPSEWREKDAWSLLPGLAALVFAIHPWAAEPACYVSARSGSLGTFFVLLGLGLWVTVLEKDVSRFKRWACVAGALLCALAAFGTKEAFITAPAGYLLATGPLWWRRLSAWPNGRSAAGGCAILVFLAVLAALGLLASERASGLWNQTDASRSWKYFFEVQNPILFSTFFDQWSVQRLSLEANHPGWAHWACGCALACTMVLILFSFAGAARWPVLLGVGWYYLHLLPTNSILPRADFLGARNVYLSVAGMATFHAGIGLWAWAKLNTWSRKKACMGMTQALAPERPTEGQAPRATGSEAPSLVMPRYPWIVAAAGLALWFFWLSTSWSWARSFLHPEQVWAKSAQVAPDHATVRLNLACAILRRRAPKPSQRTDREEALQECMAALAAEDSPTMSYYTERPKALRRALAFRLLGLMHRDDEKMEEAERCFRKSWELFPSLVTWVGWAAACLEGELSSPLQDVLAEGLRRWPEAWWPLAVRGLQHAGPLSGDRLPIGVRRDLEAASQAPPPQILELCSLRNLAIYRLEQADQARKDWKARLDSLRRWAEAAPDSSEAQNGYAWALLTCADPALRDAKAALPLAQKAAELSKRADPAVLDTLALALFENQQTGAALKTEEEALKLLPANTPPAARKEYEDRLARYQQAPKE